MKRTILMTPGIVHTIGAISVSCCLIAVALGLKDAHAQVTVTEIKVIDKYKKGVKSHIIERTRDKKDLTIDDTDDAGFFKKPIKCAEWHKLFARPVGGPYTQSDYKACDTTMVLEVWNVNNFPETRVMFIVPYAPGGASDTLGRILAQELTQKWQQQVFVENRAGASGIIGTAVVAESAPNGYTLLLGASQIFTINPSLYSKQLQYDPVRDFAAVTTVATVPDLLVVTPSLPVGSIKELVTLARARPGEINFGSSGSGTPSHLAGVLFENLTGARIIHVPYKGSSAAVADLVGGQVQITFSSAPTVASRVSQGQLKVLGVTGAKRSALFPDIPTIAEAGVPGYEVTSWYGLFAPAGTPREVIYKLNLDVNRALVTPEVRNKLLSAGAEPTGGSSDQLAAMIQSDVKKWAKLVRAAGMRVD